MSIIKVVEPIRRLTALQLSANTPLSSVKVMCEGTGTVLTNDQDGLYLFDGEERVDVEIGDYLVRLADDIFVYEAPEFEKHFRF